MMKHVIIVIVMNTVHLMHVTAALHPYMQQYCRIQNKTSTELRNKTKTKPNRMDFRDNGQKWSTKCARVVVLEVKWWKQTRSWSIAFQMCLNRMVWEKRAARMVKTQSHLKDVSVVFFFLLVSSRTCLHETSAGLKDATRRSLSSARECAPRWRARSRTSRRRAMIGSRAVTLIWICPREWVNMRKMNYRLFLWAYLYLNT